MNNNTQLEILMQDLNFDDVKHLMDKLKKSIDLGSHEKKIQFIKDELANNRYEINSPRIVSGLLEYYTERKHALSQENTVTSE